MFVQVIEGRVAEAEGLQRQAERWQRELKPGAKGYLGSTGGVADDGTSVVVVRFESEEAARRNSERPEQGEWWAETAKYYDGEVTFRDSTDAEVVMGPGNDEAGFVQVMQGHCTDRQRLEALESALLPELRSHRPDVIGGLRAWHGDNRFTMVNYFTTEAAAREGEAKPPPPDPEGRFADWPNLLEDVRYIDLRQPWLDSA